MNKIIIFIALLFTVTYAAKWYRIANHLGATPPKAIKFKQCGLGSVYVNGKDSGRIGFGVDLGASAGAAVGICDDGDKKRTIDPEDPESLIAAIKSLPEDSDEVESYKAGRTDTYVANDATANMHVYWGKSGSEFTDANRVLLRVVDGGVSYTLPSGTAVNVEPLSGDEYVGSGSSLVKVYNDAMFYFRDGMRTIMQNWIYHSNNQENCQSSHDTANGNDNEMIKAYPKGGATDFKTRVRFEFNGNEVSGHVQVYLTSDASKVYVHYRGIEGASYNPSWGSIFVQVKNAATDADIFDETTTAVTSYRKCSGMTRGAPLASSS